VGVGKGKGAIKINVNAFAVIPGLPAFTAARAGCFAMAGARGFPFCNGFSFWGIWVFGL
jgi:hypothetical protein